MNKDTENQPQSEERSKIDARVSSDPSFSNFSALSSPKIQEFTETFLLIMVRRYQMPPARPAGVAATSSFTK